MLYAQQSFTHTTYLLFILHTSLGSWCPNHRLKTANEKRETSQPLKRYLQNKYYEAEKSQEQMSREKHLWKTKPQKVY